MLGCLVIHVSIYRSLACIKATLKLRYFRNSFFFFLLFYRGAMTSPLSLTSCPGKPRRHARGSPSISRRSRSNAPNRFSCLSSPRSLFLAVLTGHWAPARSVGRSERGQREPFLSPLLILSRVFFYWDSGLTAIRDAKRRPITEY